MWLKIKSASYFYVYAWVVLFGVVSAFVFKVTLQSDLLFFDSFAEDILRFDGAFSSWKFPAAPALFPDVLLYLLSSLIFDGAVVRVFFVCVIQSVLLAWGCLYLANVVRLGLSKWAKSLIILLVTLITLVSQHSNMWLFFNSTNNHYAALLFSLFGLAYLVQYMRHRNPLYLFGIAGVSFLGGSSTSLFVLTFTIPVGIVSACYIFFLGRRTIKAVLPVFLAAIIGYAAATRFLLAILPFSTGATNERLAFSPDRIITSLSMVYKALVLSTSNDNLYTLTLSAFFIFVFVALIIFVSSRLRISELAGNSSLSIGFEVPANQYWIACIGFYWVIASATTILGSILTGAFVDPWGFRYFSFTICLTLLISVLLLDAKGVLEKRYFRSIIFFGLVFCIVLTSRTWINFFENSQTVRSDLYRYGKKIYEAQATCLKGIESGGFDFGAGIGDYWIARGLRYRLDNKNFILPILNNGRVFFHMTGLGPLEDQSKYGVGRYNFAILNKSNTQTEFNLTPETIGLLLPRPTAIYGCQDTAHEVWVYSDDKLDRFIGAKVNQFLFDLGRSGSVYEREASSLPGQVGKKEGATRLAEQNLDLTGFLTYGPYIRLSKGSYVLSIDYEATADGNKWDFGVFGIPNSPPVSLGEGLLPRSASGQVEHSFVLNKDISHFEIRTWYGGLGRLVVNKVQIRQAP